MHSYLLLAAVACLLAVPGIAASLATFGPQAEVSALTRSAAAFGLGYAAAGGIAFGLAAAHAFSLALFLPLWAAVSLALWVLALRRAPLRDQLRAFGHDLAASRLPLLLGALVLLVFVALHLQFLHDLGASRYIYYLNGIEIANSHGVPANTLEYGQWWPPATDKIFLDSFTGVLVMIGRNVAVGPGVLLLASIVGAGIGLWAAGWELGLRWTSALVPVLAMSGQAVFNTSVVSGTGAITHRHSVRVSTAFTEYRADDFGWAIAFCALALGIYAIRKRQWGPAVAAGIVLGAASGTHLIPVVVTVIALCFVGVAELLRDEDNRARLVTLRQGFTVAGVGGLLGLVIRIFAGGSFGLSGASNPAAYNAVHTSFDPTYYLFTGKYLPKATAAAGHWYVAPAKVVADLTAATGLVLPSAGLLVLYAVLVVAAIALFAFARDDLRTIGVVGAGTLLGLIGVALYFSFSYRIYVDGTFGVRRLAAYASLGIILLGLGVIEALLLSLATRSARAAAALAVVLVAAVCAWVIPVSVTSAPLDRISRERIMLTDWLRAHTPCDARILVNQRTEGAITALTGRFALLEGMGAYLRTDKLPYVISLFLDARHFFGSPQSSEAFLRQHDISYVVLARDNQLLGYPGPTGPTNYPAMRATPFLHRVLSRPFVTVYQVQGSAAAPVSPLLRGPYLHCLTTPVRF